MQMNYSEIPQKACPRLREAAGAIPPTYVKPFFKYVVPMGLSSLFWSVLKESTVLVLRMVHRKWKETKQQPSMLPGLAVPGCCLVSFRFLCDIHSIQDCTSVSDPVDPPSTGRSTPAIPPPSPWSSAFTSTPTTASLSTRHADAILLDYL